MLAAILNAHVTDTAEQSLIDRRDVSEDVKQVYGVHGRRTEQKQPREEEGGMWDLTYRGDLCADLASLTKLDHTEHDLQALYFPAPSAM